MGASEQEGAASDDSLSSSSSSSASACGEADGWFRGGGAELAAVDEGSEHGSEHRFDENRVNPFTEDENRYAHMRGKG